MPIGLCLHYVRWWKERNEFSKQNIGQGLPLASEREGLINPRLEVFDVFLSSS